MDHLHVINDINSIRDKCVYYKVKCIINTVVLSLSLGYLDVVYLDIIINTGALAQTILKKLKKTMVLNV